MSANTRAAERDQLEPGRVVEVRVRDLEIRRALTELTLEGHPVSALRGERE